MDAVKDTYKVQVITVSNDLLIEWQNKSIYFRKRNKIQNIKSS